MPIQRVVEAIEELKHGNMIVMIDDEDRENEGDLVYASMFSTPEHVNFMATYGKGLICVATSQKIANRLELTPMVPNNNSSYETAFTVSVDAADATTGISAGERDMTIKIMSDPLSKAQALVRPGHIFPLVAKDGGVLERIGHTEGSVDLCKLAGLSESAVICEIMKDDGTMARRDDLDIFTQNHNLKTVYISDLVEYRLAKETLVEAVSEENVSFFGVNVIKKIFKDHNNIEHTAMIFYNVHKECTVKVHSIISDLELLMNQKHYEHTMQSIDYLKNNGGVLIFMNKHDRHNPYMKEYGIGAQILKSLGVERIRLITNSKDTEFVGLNGFGLQVVKTIQV